MTPERIEIVRRLEQAIADHSRLYRDRGDYKSANERIIAARREVDEAWSISTIGILGNDTVLRILR